MTHKRDGPAGIGEAALNFRSCTSPLTAAAPTAQVTRRIDPSVDAVLDLLCELFPKAFVRHEARRRPLKIGIRDDLLAALDGAVTPAELSRALGFYCGNKVYRSRLHVGATRIDLSGQPSGIVSQEHAVATIEKLAKGGEHYKKTTGVAKPPVQTLEEQGVDKHLAKPPPKPAPLPPVRRMSLRDLREAAARRKAGAS
jgi:ProP effector